MSTRKGLIKSQAGSTMIFAIFLIAAITGIFFWNQHRLTNVTKSINRTINSYNVDARLLEVRSILTNAEICESSLKGSLINQPSTFSLKSNTGPINLNFSNDDLKVVKLQLVPIAGMSGEIVSAQIDITIESESNNKKILNIYPVFYNFLVNTSNSTITQCLGEKNDESDELFRTTLAQKRADICKDALKGTIQGGKCVWPW